jgi:hypothetical protein
MTAALDMKSFEMMGFEELSVEEMALVDGGATAQILLALMCGAGGAFGYAIITAAGVYAFSGNPALAVAAGALAAPYGFANGYNAGTNFYNNYIQNNK